MAFTAVTATILAGQSLSASVNVSTGQLGIKRIAMPNSWSRKAWLTFQMSYDNITFREVYWPNGTPVIVTVVPGATIVTDSDVWQAAYFKFRSGSATDPIIQPVDCVFTCMVI